MAKTAEQLDAEYENDDLYYQGVPTLTDQQVEEIYKKAGINIKTGLATGKTVNGELVVTVSPNLQDSEKPVTLHTLKETARRCGCTTCTGALAGIADAVKWYRVNRAAHVYARKNRQYFIQRLREVIASPTVNHN